MSPTQDKVSGSGIAFAGVAYLLWGFLPVLFFALRDSAAPEIVAWRIVLSLVFCVLLITVTRGWPRLLAILRDRRTMLGLALAAAFILVNWTVYVFASISGHVIEASLGYFTNPIVTVLLGVVILRERLRPMQWVALGVSVVAVLVIAVGYGAFPWVAVTLAFSFGFYGLVKKKVGPSADALSGLTIETAVLAPAAVGALILIGATSGLSLGALGASHALLMLSLGIATAVPLILFAAAARRLPLVYLGLAQYLAPILQLIVGVVLLREAMPPERWLGFGIVWLALVILTVDMLMHTNRQRGVALPEATGAP
ncbi:MAG: EamA family transporter RarD [Salinibacterium sp.]|nr:EamA family transporter RarD [Salinibacterium sp.]